MENKLNRFVKYPILVIAAVISISGIRWLVSSEPWILDQVANEERLAMTFNELFLIEGNDTLATYLKQIYRFLGLYVFGTGLMLIVFACNKFFKEKSFRNKYLFVLGFLYLLIFFLLIFGFHHHILFI